MSRGLRGVRVVAPVVWANLRGQRIQAGLIALTLAACGGLLTFGLSARSASTNAFDHLWHRTNGADLWLYLDASRVNAAQVNGVLAKTGDVVAWSEPQPEAAVSPAGVVQSTFAYGSVARDWPTGQSLGRPVMVSGRVPRADDGDVAVLDLNVARNWGLAVGGTVGIPTPAGVRTFRVVGLDANAENCAYPLCGPQTLYVAPGHLHGLGLVSPSSPGELAVPVRVRHATPARVNAVRDAITARLPAGAVAYAAPASVTRQFAALGYATQSGLMLAFAMVAAIASILLIVVAIGGAVRADSRRIGLLKAVGFSTRQLRLAVVGEYVVLGAVGAGFGAALASALAPRVLASVSRQYGAGSPAPPWLYGIVAVVGVTALTGLVVLVASRRSVRLDVVSALRSDPTGSRTAAPLLPGPVVVSRAAGELRAGRARAALTGMAVAVAAGALVMAVLFQSELGVFVDRLVFDGARTGDLVVRGSDQLSATRAASVLHRQDGVLGIVQERFVDFTLAGSTETLQLRLRSGDLTTIPQSLVSGRQLRQSGELVVGYGLARKHNLRAGDDLRISVSGEARTFRVVGVNREINNLGQMATTLASSVPGTPPLDQPQYLVRVRRGTDPGALAARIQTAGGGLLEPTVINAAVIPPILRSIRPVIRALAGVLALLTALGVFNSVLLGVQERRREFGLVRAVGMTQRQVLAVALTATGLLALAACLVVVPVTAVGGRALLSAIQAGLGVGPMGAPIPPAAFAVGPLVLLVALIGAAGPAWSASRTGITAVLREL